MSVSTVTVEDFCQFVKYALGFFFKAFLRFLDFEGDELASSAAVPLLFV